jgi:hypothetical protein
MSRKFDYLGDVQVFPTLVEHGSFNAHSWLWQGPHPTNPWP